jgi:hypothetical protein
MDQILIAWISGSDVDLSIRQQHGPASALLKTSQYSQVFLLCSYPKNVIGVPSYLHWLEQQHKNQHQEQCVQLANSKNIAEMYLDEDKLLTINSQQHPETKSHLNINLGPPAMQRCR